MNDLLFASISELLSLYRNRQLSAVEVTGAALAAIDSLNPRLNAFLAVDGDRALAEAAAADEARSRGDDGPLLGVPVSIKDLIDRSGEVTTAGSRAWSAEPAKRDSAVVERLRFAGAIVLGKTNLHELAFGATNENPHFGAVRNPWSPSHIPGGSSGGAAAAVAAGLGYAAIGSDTGGSIRIPASLCGVTGLKPTYGLVSTQGVVPLAPSLDHVGPIARSATDCLNVLAAIANGGSAALGGKEDGIADPVTNGGRSIRGLRIGRLRGAVADGTEMDIRSAVDAAVRTFVELGALVQDVETGLLTNASAINHLLVSPEAAVVHGQALRRWPDRIGDAVRLRLRVGEFLPADSYVDAQRARRKVASAVSELFDRFDALVLATTAVVAGEIGATSARVGERRMDPNAALVRLTTLFNLTGSPAISVPCGFDRSGMPIGLQIAGKPYKDREVTRIAAAFQAVTDFHQRRPPEIS